MYNQTRNIHLSDEEILDRIIFSIPFLQAGMKEDIRIDICNKTTWLANFNGKNMTLDLKPGDAVSKDDYLIQNALRGIEGVGRPPFNVYKMHFLGKATPIRNGRGEVIGAMGTGHRIDDIAMIEEMIHKLNVVSNNLNDTLSTVKTHAEELELANQTLFKNTNSVQKNSNQINEIVSSIANIATHTNVLGLNAWVVAEKSGEMGKVFAVIAKEIRNVSKDSTVASKKISEYTDRIKNEINNLIVSLENIDQSINKNTEIVGSFSETNEQLNEVNDVLNQYIKKITSID